MTLQQYDFATPTTAWTISLSGTDACSEIGVAMLIDDPEDALPELAVSDSEGDAAIFYRDGLTSDRGLPLDGPATVGQRRAARVP